VAAARSTGLRPIHFSNRVETAARFSASLRDNHYKIVIIVQDKFSGDHLPVEKQKIDMKTTKAVLAAMVGIGIACSAAVQLKGNLEKWSS
jgi:hypothetical protein